jgi:hypothetical protein
MEPNMSKAKSKAKAEAELREKILDTFGIDSIEDALSIATGELLIQLERQPWPKWRMSDEKRTSIITLVDELVKTAERVRARIRPA